MADGWQDLPGGGNVRMKNGRPTHVGDKGRWALDENQILSEAAAVTGMKLTWATLDRSSRWHRPSLISALTMSQYSQACIAAVLPAGCDRCGSDVGIDWAVPPGESRPMWCCRKCSKELSANA